MLTGGPGAGKTALLELVRWPGPDSFWDSVGTTQAAEISRYDAVIHLRTPTIDGGYNQGNPLRTESAAAAAEIDTRLLQLWETHPHRFIVPSSQNFLEKAGRAVAILEAEMPRAARTVSRVVLEC